MTVVLQDRNGFSETVSQQDRLQRLSNLNFLDPQPYQKVIRVFHRTSEGSIPSVLTTYHSNGHLHHFLEVINGRAQGSYRQYHANGKLKIEAQVTGGVADLTEAAMATWQFDGEAKVYDQAGRLEAIIPYLMGRLHGCEQRFFGHGARMSCRQFEDGTAHGPQELWSESGQLLMRAQMVRGQLHGIRHEWTAEGQLRAAEEWSEGKLMTARYPGIQAQELPVQLGVEAGCGWQPDFAGGRLIGAGEVLQGLRQGRVLRWESGGKIERSWEELNGSKNGLERLFEPSTGRTRLEMTWESGMLTGPCRCFDMQGNLESQWEMLDNQRHGRLISWYRNGRVMMLEDYDRGRLIRGEYFEMGSSSPVSRVDAGFGTATIFRPDGRPFRVISIQDGQPSPHQDS